ncbi:MAG: efflux RND transporter periplasmic adaptor subunit [Synergistaceae bacterium]|nr:efflux RND transporter periplasmic adaptor subunit [Synergistaceae bacterium]
MKRLIEAVIVIGLVAGSYYGLEIFREQKAEEPKVEVVRPVKTVLLSNNGQGGVLHYYGTLQGGQRVDLSFRVPGPLRNIYVKRGASVRKGELLAALDPRDFQSQLKQARSREAQAQAQYKNAEANFKRYENLYKEKVVPKSTYDAQQTALDVSRSNLDLAKAQTASIRDSLRDTELRAPFSGVIIDQMVENFQDVMAKQAIFSLQDISTMEVVFNVPDTDVIVASMTRERPTAVEARFDAIPDRTFPLSPREVRMRSDASTNTFAVTAAMPTQNDVALLPGMAANVDITFEGSSRAAADNTFIVPSTALVDEAGGKNFVWRYDNGKASKIEVIAGNPHSGGLIRISGAKLHGGDRIITAGTHLLHDGQRVKLMD